MKALITVLCWFIPFRKIRHQLRRKYAGGIIKYHDNNKIIVHLPNGKTVVNPSTVPGLKVRFNGKNALIELFYPIIFNNCEFNLMNDCVFTIHDSYGIKNTIIYAYDESVVFFDKNVGIEGARIHMMNERGTVLKIAKDVVLSYDIEIYTTDTHPILDMNGVCINNKKSCVSIGEHSWICASCVLLKGARIPDNVILGHSSVCSSKLPRSNCIYAGNPCKCVKENINWKGGTID